MLCRSVHTRLVTEGVQILEHPPYSPKYRWYKAWLRQCSRWQTTSAAADAAAREALFREALQELTLFKSRTSAALLQAQEQLTAARADADEMEANYRSTWEAAQTSQSRSTALLEQLSQVRRPLIRRRRTRNVASLPAHEQSVGTSLVALQVWQIWSP